MIVNYNVNTRHIKDNLKKKKSVHLGLIFSPLLFTVQCPGANGVVLVDGGSVINRAYAV